MVWRFGQLCNGNCKIVSLTSDSSCIHWANVKRLFSKNFSVGKDKPTIIDLLDKILMSLERY